ncbi:hypothetical protein [Actinomadura bangladeshensis]|uniref:Uncharacterized protein n=1 Tax=Actinomadura bangladeshensis TaxID=453573 RepID=A0A4R4P8S0_9ACTN|nr:hypothetical protein [Actinomadura bangladeshensis]TDC17247.1 hypothetical protein E1284_09855 [Actinomadura bangladeshensis]
MRHLTPSFASGALRRGEQIEQLLGGFDHGDQHIIPGKDHIILYRSQVTDVGSDAFKDVSQFPPLDPDEATLGRIIGSAAGPDEVSTTPTSIRRPSVPSPPGPDSCAPKPKCCWRVTSWRP